MRGHKKIFFRRFKYYFKKMFCIEAKDWPSIRMNIANFIQFGIEFCSNRKVGNKNQIVIFSGFPVFFIDIAYFRCQNKAYISSASTLELMSFKGPQYPLSV